MVAGAAVVVGARDVVVGEGPDVAPPPVVLEVLAVVALVGASVVVLVEGSSAVVVVARSREVLVDG